MANYEPGSGATPTGPGQGSGDEVVCPNCKGANPRGAATCQWCGSSLQATAQGQPSGYQPPMPAGGYAPPPAGAPHMGQPTQPVQFGSAPAPGYAPPAVPQMGVTGVPPRKKRSPLLIIGLVLLGLILVCVIGFVALFGAVIGATQPMANAGDAYMTALRDGDYNKAFSLSTTSLQQEVSNAAGLQTALGTKPVATWNFTSRNVTNGQGTLSGTTTYKSGASGTVDMVLNQVGNDWKVAGVSLK